MISPLRSPKILHILDHSLPLHSGYTFRTHNILRVQKKMGWSPVALTSPKHEESWKGESSAKDIVGGFTYYRAGRVRAGTLPMSAEVRLMAALARRIREVASLESPDVLHPHSPVLNALPALWAGRRLGLPVVYDIRAFWEDAAVDHGSYGPHSWKYRLVRAVETWVCRRADQVAVLCGGLKDDLTGRGIPGEKLTVVPNGISIEDFGHSEPNEQYRTAWSLAGKRVVGFIGSFYRYEGLDLLVKAFARLAPARPDLRLLLVGGGEVEGELRADVTRLALDEKVIMPGRLPHEVIPGIYGLTDVLAYPRHAMRLTELVTPLKPLEAMAQGKAIVASDIGGHRELIQHGRTGLLFRPDDASALAEALAALLDDGQLQRSLADEAARTVRQERSWDQTLSAYADIYARLGSGHAARIR